MSFAPRYTRKYGYSLRILTTHLHTIHGLRNNEIGVACLHSVHTYILNMLQ